MSQAPGGSRGGHRGRRILRHVRRPASRGHAIIEAVKPLNLNVRVGVHIGEVQVGGRYVEGANVHLAARVMSQAKPGEVLVSEAVQELLSGSDVHLADRGDYELKGVPGEVRLFSALA